MDVKITFLNGDLKKKVYMKPPLGYSCSPNKVCLPRKSLYGLKQAPREWFEKFSNTISNLDFSCSLYDFDGIIDLKASLHHHFEIKDLGSLSYFLGLKVISSNDGICLSQANQFLSAPRTTHYAIVLRIFRYIMGTMFQDLHFSTQSFLTLHAYSDADWVGDLTDRRSTNRYCLFLGDFLISWHAKKQTFTAQSSTEAEYHVLADTSAEVVVICWLLEDLGVPQTSPTDICCDNRSVI
ncbi:secreted RxLR effector protein 161-like [Arachis hypogaea]|uniref:secreted RxLR effector protein 161-like n=1 Tax=Arachis hypogaea TaxID=3818 RepID=UPI003B21DA5C